MAHSTTTRSKVKERLCVEWINGTVNIKNVFLILDIMHAPSSAALQALPTVERKMCCYSFQNTKFHLSLFSVIVKAFDGDLKDLASDRFRELCFYCPETSMIYLTWQL